MRSTFSSYFIYSFSSVISFPLPFRPLSSSDPSSLSNIFEVSFFYLSSPVSYTSPSNSSSSDFLHLPLLILLSLDFFFFTIYVLQYPSVFSSFRQSFFFYHLLLVLPLPLLPHLLHWVKTKNKLKKHPVKKCPKLEVYIFSISCILIYCFHLHIYFFFFYMPYPFRTLANKSITSYSF